MEDTGHVGRETKCVELQCHHNTGKWVFFCGLHSGAQVWRKVDSSWDLADRLVASHRHGHHRPLQQCLLLHGNEAKEEDKQEDQEQLQAEEARNPEEHIFEWVRDTAEEDPIAKNSVMYIIIFRRDTRQYKYYQTMTERGWFTMFEIELWFSTREVAFFGVVMSIRDTLRLRLLLPAKLIVVLVTLDMWCFNINFLDSMFAGLAKPLLSSLTILYTS